jgi:hypothetical protein
LPDAAQALTATRATARNLGGPLCIAHRLQASAPKKVYATGAGHGPAAKEHIPKESGRGRKHRGIENGGLAHV